MLIIILGSYEGDNVQNLERLRDYLQRAGYTQTYLVSDHTKPKQKQGEPDEAYFLRKSYYWLEMSDVRLFVLVHGYDTTGVAMELQYTHDHLCNKWDTSATIISYRCRHTTSSLLRGVLTKMKQRFFKSEKQYTLYAENFCLAFVRDLEHILSKR